MKFLLTIVVYLLMGLLLGSGMLLAIKGEPWLLIVGVLGYALTFAKVGCLPGKSHG